LVSTHLDRSAGLDDCSFPLKTVSQLQALLFLAMLTPRSRSRLAAHRRCRRVSLAIVGPRPKLRAVQRLVRNWSNLIRLGSPSIAGRVQEYSTLEKRFVQVQF
jgi:hypothetical protein